MRGSLQALNQREQSSLLLLGEAIPVAQQLFLLRGEAGRDMVFGEKLREGNAESRAEGLQRRDGWLVIPHVHHRDRGDRQPRPLRQLFPIPAPLLLKPQYLAQYIHPPEPPFVHTRCLKRMSCCLCPVTGQIFLMLQYTLFLSYVKTKRSVSYGENH